MSPRREPWKIGRQGPFAQDKEYKPFRPETKRKGGTGNDKLPSSPVVAIARPLNVKRVNKSPKGKVQPLSGPRRKTSLNQDDLYHKLLEETRHLVPQHNASANLKSLEDFDDEKGEIWNTGEERQKLWLEELYAALLTEDSVGNFEGRPGSANLRVSLWEFGNDLLERISDGENTVKRMWKGIQQTTIQVGFKPSVPNLLAPYEAQGDVSMVGGTLGPTSEDFKIPAVRSQDFLAWAEETLTVIMNRLERHIQPVETDLIETTHRRTQEKRAKEKEIADYNSYVYMEKRKLDGHHAQKARQEFCELVERDKLVLKSDLEHIEWQLQVARSKVRKFKLEHEIGFTIAKILDKAIYIRDHYHPRDKFARQAADRRDKLIQEIYQGWVRISVSTNDTELLENRPPCMVARILLNTESWREINCTQNWEGKFSPFQDYDAKTSSNAILEAFCNHVKKAAQDFEAALNYLKSVRKVWEETWRDLAIEPQADQHHQHSSTLDYGVSRSGIEGNLASRNEAPSQYISRRPTTRSQRQYPKQHPYAEDSHSGSYVGNPVGSSSLLEQPAVARSSSASRQHISDNWVLTVRNPSIKSESVRDPPIEGQSSFVPESDHQMPHPGISHRIPTSLEPEVDQFGQVAGADEAWARYIGHTEDATALARILRDSDPLNAKTQSINIPPEDAEVQRQELFDRIRAFITSPDIARIIEEKKEFKGFFGKKTSWRCTPDAVIRWMHELAAVPWSNEELRGFIDYSNEIGELFYCKTVRGVQWVMRDRRGWETVPEKLIVGPERRSIPPVPPKGYDYWKFVCRLFWKELEIASASTGCLTEGAIREILKNTGRGKSPGQMPLHEILNHCDAICELFMWENKKTLQIRRIRNGWAPGGTNNVDEVLPLPYRPVDLDGWKVLMKEAYIGDSGDEWRGYRPWCTFEELRQIFNNYFRDRLNTPMPRHRFMVYLRACRDRGTLFTLYKGNMVRRLESGWGD